MGCLGVQWSKATYTYGAAACLLELGGKENAEEAGKLLVRVAELKQRIAGKSIPLEVSRIISLWTRATH
jgi:hypothetical protein